MQGEVEYPIDERRGEERTVMAQIESNTGEQRRDERRIGHGRREQSSRARAADQAGHRGTGQDRTGQ